MFSAVFLVCAVELGGCKFFVDPMVFRTVEECKDKAELTLQNNQAEAAAGRLFEHESEYQCISWEKA